MCECVLFLNRFFMLYMVFAQNFVAFDPVDLLLLSYRFFYSINRYHTCTIVIVKRQIKNLIKVKFINEYTNYENTLGKGIIKKIESVQYVNCQLEKNI